MRRYGTPIRTRTNREQDALRFVACARPEKVATHTAESLAALYGVRVEYARGLLERKIENV